MEVIYESDSDMALSPDKEGGIFRDDSSQDNEIRFAKLTKS